MKLQKQKAYEYKGKIKYKWVIVIPNEDIEKLGWNEGMDLIGSVEFKDTYLITSLKE